MFFDKIASFYSKLQAEWLKIFYIWPLTYLTPFSSLSTFLLITIQMIWTFIFVYNGIGNSIEYSMNYSKSFLQHLDLFYLYN